MTSLWTGTKEVVAQMWLYLKKSSVNLWKFSDLHFNHIPDHVLKQSVPLLNRNLGCKKTTCGVFFCPWPLPLNICATMRTEYTCGVTTHTHTHTHTHTEVQSRESWVGFLKSSKLTNTSLTDMRALMRSALPPWLSGEEKLTTWFKKVVALKFHFVLF